MSTSDLTSLMAAAIGISMGVLTGYLADRKNRGGPAWGVGGFLFWPVALPWILALSAKPAPVPIPRVQVAPVASLSEDRMVLVAWAAVAVGVASLIFSVAWLAH